MIDNLLIGFVDSRLLERAYKALLEAENFCVGLGGNCKPTYDSDARCGLHCQMCWTLTEGSRG